MGHAKIEILAYLQIMEAEYTRLAGFQDNWPQRYRSVVVSRQIMACEELLLHNSNLPEEEYFDQTPDPRSTDIPCPLEAFAVPGFGCIVSRSH